MLSPILQLFRRWRRVAKLSSITLTDSSTPTLALTAAQYSADGTALGKITSAYNLTISGVTVANASAVAGAAHVT